MRIKVPIIGYLDMMDVLGLPCVAAPLSVPFAISDIWKAQRRCTSAAWYRPWKISIEESRRQAVRKVSIDWIFEQSRDFMCVRADA